MLARCISPLGMLEKEVHMQIDNLVPIAEYAARIGRDPATVRQKILRGALPGAVKIGRDWLIPADAPYTDARIKSSKYTNWRRKAADNEQTV